jgi:glycosyltransferase involved in cell wall biosynthesis
MPTPLISICVPNLNKRQFLAERMETLLAQTFTDWEMIVCDSYSDDGSWEFFQKFKVDPRIRLYQVPRAGLYAGWNECLKRVRGEYVNIATSDDTADQHLLERLIQPLQARPEIHLSVCDFAEIDEHSKGIKRRQFDYRDFLGEWLNRPSLRDGKTEFLLHAWFGTIWITMAAAMFRRSLLDRIGYFPVNRGSFGDYEWSMRASLQSDIAYIPGELTTFRLYQTQATPTRWSSKEHRLNAQCVEAVVDDERSGLPISWKTIPHWREKILDGQLHEYHKSFDLHRWILRAAPARFGAGVLAALKADPAWFLHQTARGFPCETDKQRVEKLLALLKQFDGDWPPMAVKDWRANP